MDIVQVVMWFFKVFVAMFLDVTVFWMQNCGVWRICSSVLEECTVIIFVIVVIIIICPDDGWAGCPEMSVHIY